MTKLRQVKEKLKNWNKFWHVKEEKQLIKRRIIEIDKSEQVRLMAKSFFI